MLQFLSKRRFRRNRGDGGYALLPVVGLGTAIVLTVGVVGGYAVQGMQSSGRSQGFNAAIQAAQAGVDDFVAKLRANPSLTTATTTAWTPIAGSVDGAGNTCTGTDATLPPNCPRFKYSAVPAGGEWTVTATGKSRGQERTVKVTLKKRGFTDYLYFSESEAADPNDRLAYPNIPLLGLTGAPAGCQYKSWSENGQPTRPASGCVLPRWRADDSTDGSRVHTRDVFRATGSPSFNSLVSASTPTCATSASNCVVGGSPSYGKGNPSYADDLTMPTVLTSDIAAAAATATGCTYSGPTRIKFLEGANAGKMQVWSPYSTFATTADRDRCMGGAAPNLLGLNLDIKVRTGSGGNLNIVSGLLGGLANLLLGTTCLLLGLGCPSTVNLSLSNILSGNLLGDLTSGILPSNPTPVAIPSAIYVQDLASPPPGLTATVQCLLGSAAGLGLYNLDVAATVNGALLSPSDCRAADVRVSGKYQGKTTIGTEGKITILSDLTATTENDRLGLVADGPVEVYNSLQCLLSLGTCASLSDLSGLVPSVLGLLNSGSITHLQLTNVLNSLGINKPVTVDAAIVTGGHFGVQMPLLSPVANVSLLNNLIAINIDPPTLQLNGSLAQRYKGIMAADLLKLGVNALGIDVAGAGVDMGFDFKMKYNSKLKSDPPPYLPAPGGATWDPQTFAEVKAS